MQSGISPSAWRRGERIFSDLDQWQGSVPAIGSEGEAESLFSLSWHFPIHVTAGQNVGHAYSHWFPNSLEVCKYMLENYTYLYERSRALPETIHQSSLPSEVADAVTGQLATLVKSTWWTGQGHFGVWEGLGCCGFHTTDVSYQGSFSIASIFPDLELIQMEHTTRFQREDGRMPHNFQPDFSKVDEGYDRVDMNQEYTMMVARDYFWTGDRNFLTKVWPNIVRAMDDTAKLDADGDGLPDTDTKRNTYDAWNFTGSPIFIASLTVGALKCAARLALEIGDTDRAKAWTSALDKALASIEEKLWNGEYYYLWRDGNEVDEGCMTDQISADWFFNSAGFAPILPQDRIESVLGSVFRYNFTPGVGLVNASYPPGRMPRMAATAGMQAESPWSGVEYTAAAFMIANGLVAEGLAIVRDIDDRYFRAVSGALPLGPAIDQPQSEYPFFTPQCWGIYSQDAGLGARLISIELADGELPLSRLSLPKAKGFEEATAILGDEPIDIVISSEGEGIIVEFAAPIILTPEDALIISA